MRGRRTAVDIVLLAGFAMVTGLRLQAQEQYPRAEIFGGASLLCGGCTQTGRELLGGWQAGASGNLRKYLGIAGDFGGQFRNISGIRVSQYEYLFGPQFSLRKDRSTLFAHALVGGVNLLVVGRSKNGFALGFGGGVDANVGKNFAIRVVQFDFVPSHFKIGGISGWQKDLRLGIGVVFKVRD